MTGGTAHSQDDEHKKCELKEVLEKKNTMRKKGESNKGTNFIRKNLIFQKHQTNGFKGTRHELFMKCEKLKKEMADEAVARKEEDIDKARGEAYVNRVHPLKRHNCMTERSIDCSPGCKKKHTIDSADDDGF